MDHTAVVRTKMTEKYLLNELASNEKDEFEEHFFECQECALDVSAGAQFVAHSRIVLGENSEPVPIRPTPRPAPVSHGWFAWLRPAFAAPALALLLIVAGYQNLVTVPRLQSDATQARVLPSASVNVGTWGSGGPSSTVPEGKGLVLVVRIPPDGAFARYTAELYSPGGKLESSFAVTATPGQDQWTVSVPAIEREAGTYTLTVHGFTPGGEKRDLANTSFELQIQR
jgi:hypothetical protein